MNSVAYIIGGNMNKIEFIKKYIEMDSFGEKNTIISALIECLNPDETCSLLDLEFEQDFYVRRTIPKKIGRDIENSFQKCHEDLINKLFSIYENHPYRKKQSIAYCLSTIGGFIEDELQDNITIFLLQSKYIAIRRSGYKNLRNWKNSFSDLIEHNWITFRDSECAGLIIDNFDLSYLVENIDKLQEKVNRTRYFIRLYLRLSETNHDYLQRLKSIDEITFVYISVKVNNHIDDELAFEIYEREKFSEKIGLLIWCFGKMKKWSLLEKISLEMDAIVIERNSRRKNI